MPRPKGAAEAAKDSAIAKLVDELGDLDRAITPDIKQQITRAELVRKAIRQHYADKPADAFHRAEGARFVVILGPKANEKKINIAAAAKKLGAAVFQRIATLTLTTLEKEAPHIISDVVTIEATGTRTLTVFTKEAA